MCRIFPLRWNKLRIVAAVAGSLGQSLVIRGVSYYLSRWHMDVGYRPGQPGPFSYQLYVLHGGEVGLDCRCCRASIDVSAAPAGVT